jgi:hypothetical protein
LRTLAAKLNNLNNILEFVENIAILQKRKLVTQDDEVWKLSCELAMTRSPL